MFLGALRKQRAHFSAVTIAMSVAAGGSEFLAGEGDLTESLAGIFTTAGSIAADLVGDGVLQEGHDDLGIPLQADDGELPQGDEQSPTLTGSDQILVEKAADTWGDLGS